MGGDNLGDDYKAAWGTAAKRAMSAFDGLDLSKPVTLPFGEMPAGVALNIAIFDVATHACDIAESTGQSIADTDLLETALGFGKQMIGPEFRDPGVFGPEQPCPGRRAGHPAAASRSAAARSEGLRAVREQECGGAGEVVGHRLGVGEAAAPERELREPHRAEHAHDVVEVGHRRAVDRVDDDRPQRRR